MALAAVFAGLEHLLTGNVGEQRLDVATASQVQRLLGPALLGVPYPRFPGKALGQSRFYDETRVAGRACHILGQAQLTDELEAMVMRRSGSRVSFVGVGMSMGMVWVVFTIGGVIVMMAVCMCVCVGVCVCVGMSVVTAVLGTVIILVVTVIVTVAE